MKNLQRIGQALDSREVAEMVGKNHKNSIQSEMTQI